MPNKKEILGTPAFQTTSLINIDGKPSRRFMTVYRTIGCQYNKCTMCDFSHYADKNVSYKDIINQHKSSLKILRKERISHFDLLTLGNFFNDKEISPKLRKDFLISLSKIKSLKRILIESRREYLTIEKLKICKDYLKKDQILEFALGYESSNPYIRNKILNKAVPEKYLDDCLKICKKAHVNFVSYVLIKPHLISKSDAIKDSVDTALHVLNKAKKYKVSARLCFEPVFVTTGTPLETSWKNGQFQPPMLWTIIKIMDEIANKLKTTNTKGKLFIGLSDENLSKERFTSNCNLCSKRIKSEIQKFNGHQNILKIKNLTHDCKKDWQEQLNKL